MRISRRVLVGLGVVGVAGGLYLLDLALAAGEVPRGTVIAGVDVGGRSRAAAQAAVQAEIDRKSGQDLPIRIGDVDVFIKPRDAGLSVDWPATWARVGGQPLNPIARVRIRVAHRQVVPVSAVDAPTFDRTMQTLRRNDRPPVEGGVTFDKAKPVAAWPVPGRVLDDAAARRVLARRWTADATVRLPVVATPPKVSRESVEHTLRDVAAPAVSAPVVVAGKNGHATLDPAQIASVLSFEPDGRGSLKAVYHNDTATALLAPPLAAGETQPKEATFALASGKPVVVSSVDGEKVDWAKTLELLPAALVKPHDRTVQAVYQPQYPKLTTEAAQKLGVVEPIAEFTTGGFTGASGVNIATVARKVNGAVVLPGQIFSLNGFTGPRGEAQGYVESVIIDHGRPSKAVGGGISQFATTLYNAAYFAGLQDEGHTEHSYYISRYPAAREATVFDGVIDLKFRNNTPNGLLIEATTTSSKVTVRLWGTKHVDVESVTGERTKPTEPKQITLPEGKDCITSKGAPGFTISDTRIIRDHGSGREIYRHTRNVKYDPVPNVTCKSEP